MLRDLMTIQYAYLRSRWARIRKIVGKLQSQIIDGKVDLPALREEFQKANRNFLEPEYAIPQNSFVKITDLNLTGKKAYGDLFEEDCFSESEKRE